MQTECVFWEVITSLFWILLRLVSGFNGLTLICRWNLSFCTTKFRRTDEVFCGSSRTLRGGADIAFFNELLQRLEQMRNVTRMSEVWPLIVRAYIGNGAPWKIFMLSTAELSFLGSQLSSITSGFSHLNWGNKSAFVSDFSETAGTKAWEKVWWKGEVHRLTANYV